MVPDSKSCNYAHIPAGIIVSDSANGETRMQWWGMWGEAGAVISLHFTPIENNTFILRATPLLSNCPDGDYAGIMCG